MRLNDKLQRVTLAQEGARADARAMTGEAGILRDATAADCAAVVHAFAAELAGRRGLPVDAILAIAAQLEDKPRP